MWPLLALLPFITRILGLFIIMYLYTDDLGALLTYLVVGWWVVGLVTLAICRLISDVARAVP
jgi:hypothetical protein